MNIILYLLIALALVGAGVMYYQSEDNESEAPAANLVTDDAMEVEEESEVSTNDSLVISEATVDLSGQGLETVPDYVFNELATEVLNLSDNNFSGALPGEVRQLSNLRTLDLSNNNFSGVPAEIGQLSNLEVLNLSSNPLTGLPHELGNLKKLQILDLRETNYSQQDLEVIRTNLSANVVIYTD